MGSQSADIIRMLGIPPIAVASQVWFIISGRRAVSSCSGQWPGPVFGHTAGCPSRRQLGQESQRKHCQPCGRAKTACNATYCGKTLRCCRTLFPRLAANASYLNARNSEVVPQSHSQRIPFVNFGRSVKTRKKVDTLVRGASFIALLLNT